MLTENKNKNFNSLFKLKKYFQKSKIHLKKI